MAIDWNNFKYPKTGIYRQQFEIALTTHCNANCPLCERTDPETGVRKQSILLNHLPLEQYKNFLNQTTITSDNSVILCGDYGDPMMHPDIEEIISYTINTYRCEVSLDTNGGIRSTDFYKRLAKYKRKIKIHFSLDGFDHKTNVMYRYDVDFNKAFENLKAFASISPSSTVWKMIIFTYNIHQIDDVAKFCIDNKIKFEFYLNKRDWKYKVVDSEQIKYVADKQKEYENLGY